MAEALVAARSRLQPLDAGLPAGVRRRVPGLRREEVAQLAGISVDYLVRMEQGRGPQPSDQVLAALSRALRLTDDERDQLFHLAGSSPPRPGLIDGSVRASTLRILDRLIDLPALVLDAKGDLLAWNAMAAALLGDLSMWPPRQRNINWQRFLGSGGRVASSAEEAARTASESVAHLRSVAARYPDDPGLRRLLDDLQGGSSLFRELWAQHHVAERRSSKKTVDHPVVGSITLDCDTMLLPDTEQRLIVYSAPPGSAASEALALLRVVGMQNMPSGVPTAALESDQAGRSAS